MARRFQDDEPVECNACGDLIYAGDKYQYIKKDGRKYCCCSNEDCMSRILLELYEGDFSEVYLRTAEDHADIWGDMEYDRWKDEQNG